MLRLTAGLSSSIVLFTRGCLSDSTFTSVLSQFSLRFFAVIVKQSFREQVEGSITVAQFDYVAQS
jgi:hypothetical protein